MFLSQRTLRLLVLPLLLLAGRVFGQNEAAPPLEISVEGVSGDVRDNVLAALSIYRDRERDLSISQIRRLHAQAPAEIRRALQPFGYYRPTIDSRLRRVDDAWRARYIIAPGPPLPIGKVDLALTGEGADDREFRRLVKEFPLSRGDPLDHAAYENAKRAFQKIAAERGYFDMRIEEHEIRIDLESYEAEITLHIDTGARYRFGEITFDQDLLTPDLLERYVHIQSGQPYSSAALLQLQTALADTEFFNQVEVVADPQKAQDRAIPVHVRLTPRKPSRYSIGLGYGTDTGARAQLGWERRYLNPEGHHIRAEARLSQIEDSISTSYIIPIRDPRTDQLAFIAAYSKGSIETTDSELKRLAVSRTVARGPWREILTLNMQKEIFTIGHENGDSRLLMPDAQWSRIWGKDRIYTRNGTRVLFDVRGAAEALGSDTNFGQARINARWIQGLGENGRLIVRGDIGATNVADFSKLPPSIRFFAGGDNSVRGYAFNTLGPKNADGDVIGGKELLVGSVEYEHTITGNWSAAVFYDAGNALDKFSDPLKRGAGIGLRWKSPIGQVRLDVANALSDPDHPWRVHLNIGPDL